MYVRVKCTFILLTLNNYNHCVRKATIIKKEDLLFPRIKHNIISSKHVVAQSDKNKKSFGRKRRRMSVRVQPHGGRDQNKFAIK